MKYAKEIQVRALAWFVINSLKMFCPPCSEVFVFLIQVTDKHLCIEMNYNHPEFWPFLLKKKKTLKTAKIADKNKPQPHIFRKSITFHFNFKTAINIFVKNSFLFSHKYIKTNLEGRSSFLNSLSKLVISPSVLHVPLIAFIMKV